MDTSMKRSAAGEYRWALTLFPTHAYASEAGMSLAAYEDFYYAACLATDDDPVTAWQRQSDEVNRLSEWMGGKEEVHITAPGTDIKLNVSGRTWIPCSGSHNMPDGEFFTGPVEDSVEGEVAFSFPATYGGREVSGVKLRFEGGKVVDASAERGEDFLIEMLDTDEAHAASASWASAPTTASPRAPRRSCSTRRSAARCTWRSARATPSRAAERLRRALGHGVRPASGRLDHRGRHRAAARRQVRGLIVERSPGVDLVRSLGSCQEVAGLPGDGVHST